MDLEDYKPYFPPVWNDEVKMTLHFSPILSKTANPEGVASKLEFWKKCIHEYLRFMKKTTFTQDEIMKAFTRNNRTPHCIQAVIENMAISGEVYDMNAFLKMKPIKKLGWSAWALELSKTSVFWTLNKVKNTVWPAPSANFKYIHKQTLEDKAEELLRQCSDLRGNIIQLSELLEKCSWPSNHAEDALLAIHWLVCQNKAAVENFDINSPYKMLVKLGNIDDIEVNITEKDLGRFNLLKTIKQIEDRLKQYETKCDKARDEARVYLAKNSKSLAMCQLKKKKRYEDIINHQVNALNNLYGLLETLNQTEANQEIFETLKTANAAIKNMFKETNLNEDSVLDTMDDVRDTIETQGEIDSALSNSVEKEDNEKLEKELDDLLAEKAAEDELCKLVDQLKLPDLPEEIKSIKPRVPAFNGTT